MLQEDLEIHVVGRYHLPVELAMLEMSLSPIQ